MTSFKISNVVVDASDEKTLSNSSNDVARFAVMNRLYRKFFDVAPECTSCAGGRVNLIGEHVDYPDLQFTGDDPVRLFSMGGAIQNNYVVACGKRTDDKLVIIQLECRQRLELDLAELSEVEERAVTDREKNLPKSERLLPSWTVHTLGAIKEMVNRGINTSGVNLLLTSNVPYGAGMSNSAANCVALGLVFNALYPELKLNEKIELSMTSVAESVITLLKSIGIESYDVIGHSMGGYVALEMKRMDKNCDKLVLLNSNFWEDRSDKKIERKRVAELVQTKRIAFIKAAIPNLFMDAKEQVREVNHLIEEALLISASTIALSSIAMSERKDNTNTIIQNAADVLIVQGVHDSIVMKSLMDEKVKGMNVALSEILSGHMAHIELPEAVEDAIGNFVAKKNGNY